MEREAPGSPQASRRPSRTDETISEDVAAFCATLLAQDRVIDRETRHMLASRLEFDMLLDLYVAEQRGSSPCLWDLACATSLPSSTAHRRLSGMIRRGVLRRLAPSVDRRRVDVRLSADAKALVEHTIDRLVTWKACVSPMSPEAAATDQAYLQLKADVMRGRYAPTTALNVHMIATEIGTSISPIRDAMERLVGERLVALRPGGGFVMPRVSVEVAQDLYRWHGYLTRGALRTLAEPERLDELKTHIDPIGADDGPSLVAVTAEFFDMVGGLAGNLEHQRAIHAAGDRLHALRLAETRIKDRKPELVRLVALARADTSRLRDAIGAYHRRRLPHIGAMVSALYRPEGTG